MIDSPQLRVFAKFQGYDACECGCVVWVIRQFTAEFWWCQGCQRPFVRSEWSEELYLETGDRWTGFRNDGDSFMLKQIKDPIAAFKRAAEAFRRLPQEKRDEILGRIFP